MAYTTIDKSTDYFITKLWTGNDTAQTITGIPFAPDFVWIKNRSTAESHTLVNTVVGANNFLKSNATSANNTNSEFLKSFTSDGYTLGSADEVNNNSNNIVGWNWKAGTTSGIATNGATVTTPSSYSFNQTSRFSILQYTGTGNTNNKLAHGLGVKPDFIIFKKTSGDINWGIYHKSLTADYRLLFTTGAKSDDDSFMQDAEPDSVNINLGYGGLNNTSGATYIAYCFAPIKGFSKFSVYDGNGNANGPFIYTGFKPAWVMVKNSEESDNWVLLDNKRDVSPNPHKLALKPNTTSGDDGDFNTDFLSNGFKIRSNTGLLNNNGIKYIYMAFAEAPLVGSNNIPATAK